MYLGRTFFFHLIHHERHSVLLAILVGVFLVSNESPSIRDTESSYDGPFIPFSLTRIPFSLHHLQDVIVSTSRIPRIVSSEEHVYDVLIPRHLPFGNNSVSLLMRRVLHLSSSLCDRNNVLDDTHTFTVNEYQKQVPRVHSHHKMMNQKHCLST